MMSTRARQYPKRVATYSDPEGLDCDHDMLKTICGALFLWQAPASRHRTPALTAPALEGGAPSHDGESNYFIKNID